MQVNLRDSSGQTAFHRAARKGLVQVCKLLLTSGCDPAIKNNEGFTVEAVATTTVMKLLQEEKPVRVEADMETQLLEACKNGELETVKVCVCVCVLACACVMCTMCVCECVCVCVCA